MSELHPRTAMRCGACGNIGMTSMGLEMQDKINKLQQELDAARDDIKFLKLEIDSNKIVIKSQQEAEENLKRWLAETEQQLADAKAQIADYEAALELGVKAQEMCAVVDNKDAMVMEAFGIKARETLNKWSYK